MCINGLPITIESEAQIHVNSTTVMGREKYEQTENILFSVRIKNKATHSVTTLIDSVQIKFELID